MGCCDPKAPRLIRIRVGDGEVGISGLDTIAEAVRNLNLEDEESIKASPSAKILIHQNIILSLPYIYVNSLVLLFSRSRQGIAQQSRRQ